MASLLEDDDPVLASLREQNAQAMPNTQPASLQSVAPNAMPTIPTYDVDEELTQSLLDRQHINPRRAMWAGWMSDLGKTMSSWNGSTFTNVAMGGPLQYMQYAKKNNRQNLKDRVAQRRYEHGLKMQQYGHQMNQWKAGQPQFHTSGNDILQFDPQSQQFTQAYQGAPGKQQIFGSATSGYYRLDENNQPVQMVGGRDPDAGAKAVQNANTLRDDYSTDTKPYKQVTDQLQAGRQASQAYFDPDASPVQKQTADKSLIYNFVKAHDPGSTVSAGESADVSNTPGISASLRNIYNQVVNGQQLTDAQRRSLLQQMEQLGMNAQGKLGELNELWTARSQYSGVNPGMVIRDWDYKQPEGYDQYMNYVEPAVTGNQQPVRIDQPPSTYQPRQRSRGGPSGGVQQIQSLEDEIDLGLGPLRYAK